MPRDTKEPQSYGSQADWTSGKTGQEVTDQKSEPRPEHREFYDDRREAEENDGVSGGLTSPYQLADNAINEGAVNYEGGRDSESVPRISSQESGAKRGSFFKKRDYE